MRAATLVDPAPRPAHYLGDDRPGRWGGEAWTGPGRPGAVDRVDDGRGDRVTDLVRARFGGRRDGDGPLDQLRVGRGVCEPPMPDAAPVRQPRPGGRRPAQPDLPRTGVGTHPRPDPCRAPR